MAEVVYPSVLKSYGKELGQIPPLFAIARQIDDVLNSVIGIAPLEPALNIVRDILPANVIRNVTGIEKPSEIVNTTIDEIAEKIRSRVTTSIRR
jgi:hypothetical protein